MVGFLPGNEIRWTQEWVFVQKGILGRSWSAQVAPQQESMEHQSRMLYRKAGEWAPMGCFKGVHPDAGKGVAEGEVNEGRGIEPVGTPVMPRELVKK